MPERRKTEVEMIRELSKAIQSGLNAERVKYGLTAIGKRPTSNANARYIAEHHVGNLLTHNVKNGEIKCDPPFGPHVWTRTMFNSSVTNFREMSEIGNQLVSEPGWRAETYEIALLDAMYDAPAERIVAGFMASVEHRKMILNLGEWRNYRWEEMAAHVGRIPPIDPKKYCMIVCVWFVSQQM